MLKYEIGGAGGTKCTVRKRDGSDALEIELKEDNRCRNVDPAVCF